MIRRSPQIYGALGDLRNPLLPSLSPYVCSQCRYRTSIRQPSSKRRVHPQTPVPSPSRTYASEPEPRLGIGDRLGWYKKFETFMNKRMWKGGVPPPSPYEEQEKASREKKAGPEAQERQRPDRELPRKDDDMDYTPAVSGEGLEMIGGPTGWWEEAWDEQHQFQGFMRPIPLRKSAEIRIAIERALVEAVTLAQGPRRVRRFVKNRPRPIDVPTLTGFNLSQSEKGEMMLKWKRQEDGKDLLQFLESSAQVYKQSKGLGQTPDEDAGEEDVDMEHEEELISDPIDTESSADTNNKTAPETSEQSTTTALEDEQILAEPSDNKEVPAPSAEQLAQTEMEKSGSKEFAGLQGIISLADPELKFSVLKRAMQLTGIRIPDPAIQSINSSRDLYHELMRKPPSKKLAEVLLKAPEPSTKKTKVAPRLKDLPNVKILPNRQKPYMKESALGRKKVIEKRLEEYGIEEPYQDVMEKIEAYERKKLMRSSHSVSDSGWMDIDKFGEVTGPDTTEQARAG
ncbi:MAG: hypothetical protein Q9219_001594 [cf. Caloplaca sp. 3 TL-2023]